ncbi:RrF2 family transcriptional regulator [Halostreptopolyspora alba]
MSEGVEWALHTCLNLAWAAADQSISATRLAAFYELPAPYLNKQLQSLVRAGILTSTPGPRGGFRLARPIERVTLMDVVAAIEGPGEAFRCTEIRSRGPGAAPESDNKPPCAIDQAMRRAELAWRRELAAQTLADVQEQVLRSAPDAPERTRRWLAD